MPRNIGLTQSARYICLEGLEETNEFTNVSAVSLMYCGWERVPSGFQFGPYIRKYNVIHIVLDGKGYYRTPFGEYELHKGDAFYIEPGVETTYWADEEDPWCYTWVGFSGIRAQNLSEKMGFTMEKPVLHVKQMEEMEGCIKRMIQAKTLTIVNELRRTGELFTLFSLFIEDNDAYVEGVEQEDYPSDVYVNAAVDYMMVNYMDRIKIDDLAEHIGISRTHLTNRFKKKFGVSPQRYLIELRLEKACVMLKNTQQPIGIIASKCGYEDSMSFSRAFKAEYNMSPKAYRESDVELKVYKEKALVGEEKYPL